MPKAIARVLGLTDRAIRLAPLRADAADILHPLLFIFDTAKQVGQRYFPPGYVPSLEEDAAASLDRFLRRDVMSRFATREAHFALREALILALAGVAAFLFLNHENLYLTGPFTLSKAPLEAYFLVTTVMYLFLRLVVIALGMRVPRARPELVRCPECGQWIDDSTAAGREAQDRKSTRLNSSHVSISYAVFCFKKKIKDWFRYESHFVLGRDSLVDILKERGLLSESDAVQPLIVKTS